MDIEGVSTLADFELIEIIDDINPYPMLLGIDWATNTNGVINLKKRKMIFEKRSLRIVVPYTLQKDRATQSQCTTMGEMKI